MSTTPFSERSDEKEDDCSTAGGLQSFPSQPPVAGHDQNPRWPLTIVNKEKTRSVLGRLKPPQAVAQAATGPLLSFDEERRQRRPKGVFPPLETLLLCRGCLRSLRSTQTKRHGDAPHGTGAPLTLRNVPAGWSHQLSAGHRDILGRILLCTQMPPLTAFASGNGCPVPERPIPLRKSFRYREKPPLCKGRWIRRRRRRRDCFSLEICLFSKSIVFNIEKCSFSLFVVQCFYLRRSGRVQARSAS